MAVRCIPRRLKKSGTSTSNSCDIERPKSYWWTTWRPLRFILLLFMSILECPFWKDFQLLASNQATYFEWECPTIPSMMMGRLSVCIWYLLLFFSIVLPVLCEPNHFPPTCMTNITSGGRFSISQWTFGRSSLQCIPLLTNQRTFLPSNPKLPWFLANAASSAWVIMEDAIIQMSLVPSFPGWKWPLSVAAVSVEARPNRSRLPSVPLHFDVTALALLHFVALEASSHWFYSMIAFSFSLCYSFSMTCQLHSCYNTTMFFFISSNESVTGISLMFVCDELVSPSDFSAGLPLPFRCVSASVPPVSLSLTLTPPCYFTSSICHGRFFTP